MENAGNLSIMELTVKAGETIILKGEDGATISEVKKPKRNIQKEREWEQSKYHRFTFLVDKPQAERFIELLKGKRPLDWFREQVSSYIDNTLNVSNQTTLNVSDNDTLNDVDDLKKRLETALKMNSIEHNQELLTFKHEMSKVFGLDYADFRASEEKECSPELFNVYRSIIGNTFKRLERFGIVLDTLNVDDSTLKDGGINTLNVESEHTLNEKSENMLSDSVCFEILDRKVKRELEKEADKFSYLSEQDVVTLNDVDTTLKVESAVADEIVSTLNENNENTLNVETILDEKPKLARKPSPKPDERVQWETEYNNGLPPKRIAEIFGRDVRAVKKHLVAVGVIE